MAHISTRNLSSCTRRNFLQTTAAASGAVAASGMISRAAYARGSDEIKVGLIGCGGRGAGAAVQFLSAHPQNRLIAMADIFPERLEQSVRSLQSAKQQQFQVDGDHQFVGFDGWQRVIDSDVDVVLIACASKFHPMYTLAALQAGKHVFCEKPHAVDAYGVSVLNEATKLADEKKLCYISGLMSRYSPMLKEATQRIAEGIIGEVVAARAQFLRAPYVTRLRPESDSETKYQYRNWYHFKWLSGDDVTQSLVHNLDRVAMFTGEKQPRFARGFGGRSSSFGYEYGDQFDHNVVFYEYDSGMQTFAACTQQAGCTSGVEEFVFGTKGRMVNYHLVDHDGKVLWKYQGKQVSWHAQEQIDFSNALREGRHINNGAYAAQSTLTCILGQVACYTGQRYSREEVMQSNFNFGPKPEQCSFNMEPPVTLGPDGQYPVPEPGRAKFW